jgi:phage terminase small subunit
MTTRPVARSGQELLDASDVEWGPAMAALPSDRHRAFVYALYEVRRGYGANVKAAKMAGFGTPTSTAKTWSVIASRLAHDPRVLAAIHEEDQRRIRTSAPRAIRALQRLIEDPTHKGHERAIGMILDRVHPAETRHVVDVHHIDHAAEAVAELRMLKSLGVSRTKLEEVFGFSGLSRYERLLERDDAEKASKTIEGRAIEVKIGGTP